MKELANEVTIFIQTYEPAREDALRRMVESIAIRLQNTGITLKALDLFNLVLEEFDEHEILKGLLEEETTWQRSDVLETLQNYSDPKTHMIPRLIRAIEGNVAQLTLITGPGRIFPFLRTHTILESLQPAMLRHPVVIFFPGEYALEPTANGVWISGFFGYGKSHLLKILSLILDGQPLANGTRPADVILPKIEDEIVKANLRKATAIPSRSILFNIDQKFDGIGGDHSAPILEVFVKDLNELQGYYGKQCYIAKFEHDLDIWSR